jgi:hypothetical protein
MITSLRNRHRIIIAALAVLAPAVFVAGLSVRKPIPVSERPSFIAPRAASDSAEPDVLVYWSDVRPEAAEVPGEAKFLGRLSDVDKSSLPQRPGFILLYSLAHRKIVAIDPSTPGGAK